MNEHTSGPWNIDGGTNSKNDLFIWKKGEYYGGHAIATVHDEIQEGSEANARLIAAAPDLLAACKRARNVMEQSAVINSLPDTFGDWITIVLAELETAIAKAENRSG